MTKAVRMRKQSPEEFTMDSLDHSGQNAVIYTQTNNNIKKYRTNTAKVFASQK